LLQNVFRGIERRAVIILSISKYCIQKVELKHKRIEVSAYFFPERYRCQIAPAPTQSQLQQGAKYALSVVRVLNFLVFLRLAQPLGVSISICRSFAKGKLQPNEENILPESNDAGEVLFVVAPKSFEEWPKITMYDCDFRRSLQAMHQSITELKLWEELKEEPGQGGFTFNSAAHIRRIKYHPLNLECNHSGHTQGYAMRVMQQIARKGWKAFVAEQVPAPSRLNPLEDFVRS
jgi:hypothetical protein